MEKGSELPKGAQGRKYKGRSVFQGNRVFDQKGRTAIFEDLGSAPATIQASKCADAYGLFPGNTVEQADARQAYTQTVLKGAPTWVELPESRWPDAWKKKV